MVEGFLDLEGTFMDLSPSLASPSLPRGGENRRVGGPTGRAWLVCFDDRGIFDLEGTFMVFPPSLASPSLPRWGESRVRVGVGFGLGWWFSGRNHFVVGGVWLLYPP